MKTMIVVKPEVRSIDTIAAGIARMSRNSTLRRLSRPAPTASRTGYGASSNANGGYSSVSRSK